MANKANNKGKTQVDKKVAEVNVDEKVTEAAIEAIDDTKNSIPELPELSEQPELPVIPEPEPELLEPEKKVDAKALISDINTAINEITDDLEPTKKLKSKKATFELTDLIPCRSLFLGKLIYTSPVNGARYIWKDFGSVEHIPFGELQTMNNHKPNYLNKPLILIAEPDVVEYFNLTPVYEMVTNINKLDTLFKSGDIELIRQKIRDALTVGMRETVVAKVRKMRQENTLVDINIIKALEEELKYVIE